MYHDFFWNAIIASDTNTLIPSQRTYHKKTKKKSTEGGGEGGKTVVYESNDASPSASIPKELPPLERLILEPQPLGAGSINWRC